RLLQCTKQGIERLRAVEIGRNDSDRVRCLRRGLGGVRLETPQQFFGDEKLEEAVVGKAHLLRGHYAQHALLQEKGARRAGLVECQIVEHFSATLVGVPRQIVALDDDLRRRRTREHGIDDRLERVPDGRAPPSSLLEYVLAVCLEDAAG